MTAGRPYFIDITMDYPSVANSRLPHRSATPPNIIARKLPETRSIERMMPSLLDSLNARRQLIKDYGIQQNRANAAGIGQRSFEKESLRIS
jgi:hypothetical protein